MEITATTKLVGRTPPAQFKDATAWDVTLTRSDDGTTLTVPFYTGPAAGEPTAADVLGAVL